MFDLDLLASTDPFEIDTQAAHLFKHPYRGIDDIREVWDSDRQTTRPLAHGG